MSCNILIVDDSPILRAAMKKVAKVVGVASENVFEAGNGEEALQVLEKEWVDLILLDLNMPVMDGEAFAVELRKKPDLKDIAVAVVSTECNKARLERMKNLGVMATLQKPFEPEDLSHLIAKVLGVKR